MKLIVCLDEKNGMAFNRRRQSRDRVLTDDLVRHVGAAPLFVTPYSLPLFEGHAIDLHPCDRPCAEAPRDAWCFLETQAPDPAVMPDVLLIYRWNRHYPSDLRFTLPLTDYRLAETLEFVGSSHETITKEVWIR